MIVSCTASWASASVNPLFSATRQSSFQYVSKNCCQPVLSSASFSRAKRLRRVVNGSGRSERITKAWPVQFPSAWVILLILKAPLHSVLSRKEHRTRAGERIVNRDPIAHGSGLQSCQKVRSTLQSYGAAEDLASS